MINTIFSDVTSVTDCDRGGRRVIVFDCVKTENFVVLLFMIKKRKVEALKDRVRND